MVLSINIPEDVKSIFNSMKQLNKNRTLFDLESKVNQIYYSELNIIYGSEVYNQNYASLEDMLYAMHIIKNDGNLLQVFLDEDVFEMPAINIFNYNFENNLFLNNIENNVLKQDEYKNNFKRLQVDFENEVDDYVSNKLIKNINNRRTFNL